MHSLVHPDLALNVSWQMYHNKTIHNFIEHNDWLYWCFTAIRHILVHFRCGQLT